MKALRDSEGRFIKGSGGFTGKHSEETKLELSIVGKGRIPWNKGTKGVMKINKTSFKKGRINWLKGTKGIHQSPQTEFRKGIRNNIGGEFKRKGENLSYYGLHSWVKRRLGKPLICSNCETLNSKRYEWANISLEYKEDVNDWMRLCAKCHDSYDRQKGWGIATRRYSL